MRKALWLVVVVVVAAAALAGCWALNISLDFSSSNSGVYLFFIRVVASVAVSVSYLFSNFVFDLQKGIVRRVSYTFYTGAAVSTVVLVASWVADAGSPIFILLFMANNAVFAIRIFQEYFVYRMGHVNDIHVRQLEFEQGRTELLNRVLLSSPEEDVKLIGDTLSACREQFQKSFVKTDLVFRSMMAFRRAGDLLAVDREEFIVEYCTPLKDVENIKQMRAEVLHSQIMSQVFDLSRITQAAESELGFAEKAIKKMVETKSQVRVEDLPLSLDRLFKLIVLQPIYNQEDLRGMIVLFKSDFDRIFPQEDVILKSLVRNLSLVFTIIDSKRMLDDKNRLTREMDIAKGIQTSILPKNLEMVGYEAEAQMITASEVGGDLYDFVKTNYGGFIDIADVAGHGLPAGIMALVHMAAFHAALRTSEIAGYELEVSSLYDIVNAVLIEINRNRIGSDKFMTCNILTEREGTISYAGSHLIGLVHRVDSGAIDEIEGMQGRAAFQGISEYASSGGSKGSFSMKKGDILLLYTDGLIEARDMNDRFFGVNGLKEALREASKESLSATKQAILERLKAFAENGDRKAYGGSYADDVSLMLIRKT